MNTSLSHLQFASLVELAEKRTLVGQEEASAHLASCAQCAGELSRLQQVIGLMRTDASEDAPHNALAHALNLFDARRRAATPESRSGKSVVGRVLAALSFDSTQNAPAYGLRSAHAAARQLLFSAGDNDLDLRIAPSGDEWTLSGQVLGACTGGEIELEDAAGAIVAVASLNDACEFRLHAVPTGVYTLRLRLGESVVEVPALELRN